MSNQPYGLRRWENVGAGATSSRWRQIPDTLPEVSTDCYVGGSHVIGLNKCTFCPYVKNMDATFVMFYSPVDIKSAKARIQLRTAAARTKRPVFHKFAGVDCTKEGDLCAKQQVFDLPTYHLYSRGELLKRIDPWDVYDMKSDAIAEAVESVPPA